MEKPKIKRGGTLLKNLTIRKGRPNKSDLIAALACRWVWEVQMKALFDVRVVDTNSPSYANLTSEKVITNAEK